jgi:hypothetical protein
MHAPFHNFGTSFCHSSVEERFQIPNLLSKISTFVLWLCACGVLYIIGSEKQWKNKSDGNSYYVTRERHGSLRAKRARLQTGSSNYLKERNNRCFGKKSLWNQKQHLRYGMQHSKRQGDLFPQKCVCVWPQYNHAWLWCFCSFGWNS